MITQPTVLILGAGASFPYGFPLGRDLLFRICDQLAGLQAADILAHTEYTTRMYSLTHANEDDITEFGNLLRRSMAPSVDRFLESNPDLVRIGKAAIAHTLIPFESESTLLRNETLKWYEFLFSHLQTPTTDEFKENRLSIITYNYDRSLEHFLFIAIKNCYRLSEHKANELLQSIPIIHLHGQLGSYYFGSDQYRAYSTDIDNSILQRCIDGIKIIHEDISEEPQFEQAHTLIAQARKVCFLGFGYDKTNVDRLKIKEIVQLNKQRAAKQATYVYGSAFRLKNAQIEAVYERLGVGSGKTWYTIAPLNNLDMLLNYRIIF